MEIFSRSIAFLIILILSPVFFVNGFVFSFARTANIFYQDRVGFNFKKFKIIKFRTMINNSGPGITEHNDLRITYIGKILRMTKLDELPQLLNILFGDMRFIGPRPEIIEYFDESQFLFLRKINPGFQIFLYYI